MSPEMSPVGEWVHVCCKGGHKLAPGQPVLVAGHTETTEAGHTETSLRTVAGHTETTVAGHAETTRNDIGPLPDGPKSGELPEPGIVTHRREKPRP